MKVKQNVFDALTKKCIVQEVEIDDIQIEEHVCEKTTDERLELVESAIQDLILNIFERGE